MLTERNGRMFLLRNEGSTYRVLGEIFGITKEGARKAIENERKRLIKVTMWHAGLDIMTTRNLINHGFDSKKSVQDFVDDNKNLKQISGIGRMRKILINNWLLDN